MTRKITTTWGLLLFSLFICDYAYAFEGWGNPIKQDEPAEGLRTIVIDPGHGGGNLGTISPDGIKEKDVVLAISKKLEKLLIERLGARVIMTRSDDSYIPLQERTFIANSQAADIFISIHCNSSPRRWIKGFESYYLSDIPSDEDAELTAEAENIVLKGEEGREVTDLDLTLLDLAQSECIEESSMFASLIQKSLGQHLKEKNRGVKYANFWVLSGARMPAVLLEVGFLSNSEEAKRLNSEPIQDRIAEAIYNGILNFQDIWKIKIEQK